VPVDRVPRQLEGNVGKYDGGGSVTSPGKCADIHGKSFRGRGIASLTGVLFPFESFNPCLPRVGLRIFLNKILVV
jgi:hypothetical protein